MSSPRVATCVAVVGTGAIGRTVVHALAEANETVIAFDVDATQLESARQQVRRAHMGRVLRRASDVPVDELLARITWTADVEPCARADIVIENVTEDVQAKLAVHRVIDEVVPGAKVVAANTSAVPIGVLADSHRVPGRLLGMHFMMPATEVRAVELVRGDSTAPSTLECALAWLEGLGFRATVTRDGPGFVLNRVLMPMVNDAIALLESGIAGASEIDDLFVHCTGHRMGPLALADLIGLDTVLRTLRVLEAETGDDRFAPAPLLVQLVADGCLGRKVGAGVLDHEMKHDHLGSAE